MGWRYPGRTVAAINNDFVEVTWCCCGKLSVDWFHDSFRAGTDLTYRYRYIAAETVAQDLDEDLHDAVLSSAVYTDPEEARSGGPDRGLSGEGVDWDLLRTLGLGKLGGGRADDDDDC